MDAKPGKVASRIKDLQKNLNNQGVHSATGNEDKANKSDHPSLVSSIAASLGDKSGKTKSGINLQNNNSFPKPSPPPTTNRPRLPGKPGLAKSNSDSSAVHSPSFAARIHNLETSKVGHAKDDSSQTGHPKSGVPAKMKVPPPLPPPKINRPSWSSASSECADTQSSEHQPVNDITNTAVDGGIPKPPPLPTSNIKSHQIVPEQKSTTKPAPFVKSASSAGQPASVLEKVKQLSRSLDGKSKPPPALPPKDTKAQWERKEGVDKPDIEHSGMHSSTPNSSKSNSPTIKPPALPSKANRPHLQRQPETESSDSSEGSLISDNEDDTSSVPQVQAETKIHEHSFPDTSPPVKKDSESPSNESSPKPVRSNLQNIKPLAFLRKYLNNSEQKHSENSKEEIKEKRRSIGDILGSNPVLANMFKLKKNDSSDKTTSPKLDKKRIEITAPTEQVPNTSRSHIAPELPGRPTREPKQSNNSQGNSTQETYATAWTSTTGQQKTNSQDFTSRNDLINVASHNAPPLVAREQRLSCDECEDGEDWDEDEFSDVEPGDVPDNPEGGGCYENVMIGCSETLSRKRRRLVEELVSTETNYVNKLYLLNKTAWELEGANMATEMFHPSIVHQMFPNIEPLYRLHGENVLPAMKACLEHWRDKPELATLWRKYLPFLTMYKSYTSQYDGCLDVITQQRAKCPDFANLLARIEDKAEFGRLSLGHHLLEPVQRIARYKLLLQNYLKMLKPNEEEHKNIESVISTLDQLLNDCQGQLNKQDVFGNLLKLQDRFEDTLSMLSPTARLIKEGPCTEISAQNMKKRIQRYLFLFTDSVHVCNKRPSGKYKIIHQMGLEDLKVRPVEMNFASTYGTEKTLLLKDKEQSVVTLYKEAEEKISWEETILEAITVKMQERQLRRDGRNITSDPPSADNNTRDFNQVPSWVPDDHITSCFLCDNVFLPVVRKKVHCRGCGLVVCNFCSRQKMALPCMNGELCRVCDNCFIFARRHYPELTRTPEVNTKKNGWIPKLSTRHKNSRLDLYINKSISYT